MRQTAKWGTPFPSRSAMTNFASRWFAPSRWRRRIVSNSCKRSPPSLSSGINAVRGRRIEARQGIRSLSPIPLWVLAQLLVPFGQKRLVISCRRIQRVSTEPVFLQSRLSFVRDQFFSTGVDPAPDLVRCFDAIMKDLLALNVLKSSRLQRVKPALL
jgi:hypothetical protein